YTVCPVIIIIIVEAPLNGLISGVGVSEYRWCGHRFAAAGAGIVTGTNSLFQSFIAVLHFLRNGHRLMTRNIGKRGAVEVEVGIDESARKTEAHSIGGTGIVPGSIVRNSQSGTAHIREHHFIGYRRRADEQLTVG